LPPAAGFGTNTHAQHVLRYDGTTR
jgi:hypothetical protein